MSIKIFLPEKLFYIKENVNIYGEIKISEFNCISYYIICAIGSEESQENDDDVHLESHSERDLKFSKSLRHLGHIVNVKDAAQLQHKDVALAFVYNENTPNICILKSSIRPDERGKVNVFLYDEQRILKLQDLNESLIEVPQNTDDTNATTHQDLCPNDDMHMLYQLLRTKQKFILNSKDLGLDHIIFKRMIWCLFEFPFELLIGAFGICMTKPPLKFIFQHTVMCDYYKEWLKFKKSGKRNCNIAFDTFLGLCVNIVLALYIENPGDYLIATSNSVVTDFRLLLQSLKGSPIGLKLNVQLNNFLLDCFGYHVELWATFLNIIEPCIRQLFIPIIVLGSIGFSYQLALLTDLISVMGLHAHCFSIYAAVLYKVEIKGLQVLWKVVLGKRKNVLKNRVESHNYMNRQLYLATVFFASLLFLFPTVLTYYVVFTSLRLCIYLASSILKATRRRILEFPMEMLLRWCIDSFYDTDSLQLEFVHHTPSPLSQQNSQIQMSVFKLSVHSSSLGRVFSCQSGILQELVANEESSIKSVCQRILEGTF